MPADTQAPTITAADCRYFIDRALDEMTRITTELGDEAANRVPDLPGANSPYQLLTHCLGVCEYWGGAVIAGRDIQRDRDAEFIATGTVAPLAARVQAAKQRLDEDLTHLRPGADSGSEHYATHGQVVVHIAEELCQHLGHMEITRDVINAFD